MLGHLAPSLFHAIGAATVAQVNLPVAALVWVMIIPMLLKIDPAALREVGMHWRGIATTVGVNWLVKPFSMALLGWLFIGYLFRPLAPERPDRQLYRGPDPACGRALHGDGVRMVASRGWRAALYVEPGGAERRDHGRGFRAHRRPFARVVLDHGPVGDPVSFGRSLHRHPCHHRSTLAVPPLARGRTNGFGPHAEGAGPVFVGRVAADAGFAVRASGRADRAAAFRHCPARRSDHCASLSQCGLGLLAEPASRRRLVRGRAFRTDRRQQLLRAGGRHRDCPVRFPVRRGACNRRGCARGSAGHAVGCASRAVNPKLVRALGRFHLSKNSWVRQRMPLCFVAPSGENACDLWVETGCAGFLAVRCVPSRLRDLNATVFGT